MDQLQLESISSTKNTQVAVPDYVEFIINGEPLSEIINRETKPEHRVLSKYTSVLGTMEFTNSDRLKVMQLSGKKITAAELEKIFPAKHFDHKPILEELNLDKILIYCCAECGDYKCGGYYIQLQETTDSIIWNLIGLTKNIQFRFSKAEYMEVLSEYLDSLD